MNNELKDLINEYLNEHELNLIKSMEYYENLNLEEAIIKACSGIKFNDVMDSHQYRISKKFKGTNVFKLTNEIDVVKVSNVVNFEKLFSLISKVSKSINGIGPLWTYDTALRIGFSLKIYPQKVYVQSGVKEGLLNLLSKKSLY